MSEETTTTTYGARRPFRFLAQDSPQTLAEAMAEFAATQPGVLAPDEPELARFFHAHDACHALFGLTTAIDDEALADTWTLAGTDMTARRYFAYLKHPELRQLVAEPGLVRVALATLRAVPRLLRVLLRSRRMTAPWPFLGYAQHLETPLAELRARFGIRVV